MRALLLATALFAFACGSSNEETDTGTNNGSTSGGNASAGDPTDRCASLTCAEDEHCELRDVQCVAAPCDPVPTCVTGMHPCAATTCLTNTRCEARNGEAVCVPLPASSGGVACGRATCAEGMVCCNASCGVCTPPDGMCTQQFCGE